MQLRAHCDDIVQAKHAAEKKTLQYKSQRVQRITNVTVLTDTRISRKTEVIIENVKFRLCQQFQSCVRCSTVSG